MDMLTMTLQSVQLDRGDTNKYTINSSETSDNTDAFDWHLKKKKITIETKAKHVDCATFLDVIEKGTTKMKKKHSHLSDSIEFVS